MEREKVVNLIGSGKDTQEVSITIHYTGSGPSLESCMISILSAHISKNTNF